MKKTILITCVAALLAAPAMAQVDFSRYVALGDSLAPKPVGAPTYDIQPSLITVGTDEGRVYAVEVSSP